MSFGVMLAVLAAAFLNAAWNTSVKLLPDKFIAISLIMFGAGAVSLPFALLGLAVAPAAYPFLALSALLQVIYCVLINRAYHTADLSLAYPLIHSARADHSGGGFLAGKIRPARYLAAALVVGGLAMLRLA